MPKEQHLEIVVPGTPQQVAERLGEQTRWRFFPYQGSALGGRKTFGGRVGEDGFRLALDPRDIWTRMQAVARGKLEPHGSGSTRLTADVSMPRWLVLQLRASFILAGVALAGVPFAVMGGAEGHGGPAAAAAVAVAVLVGLLGSTLGVGWHVNHSDTQVPLLIAALERVAGGGGTAVGEAEGEDAERVEARRRAPQPQKQG